MLIRFKSIDTHHNDYLDTQVRHHGVLVGYSLDDPNGLFWAIDELSLNPYEFLVAQAKHGYFSATWEAAEDAEQDPVNHECSETDVSEITYSDSETWYKFERGPGPDKVLRRITYNG